MDPLTHAASGAVAMLALQARPSSRLAVPLAALAAAAPDVDVLLGQGPLEFLLLHRGITHSLTFLPVFSLILTLVARPLWRTTTPGHWSFGKVWLCMSGMLLLHLWLDCITTYGTMIFLPFSHLRVRFNAVYIIDICLTLPLLWALWRWRARRGCLLLALAWLFFYPGLNMGMNALHTIRMQSVLAEDGQEPEHLVVLPDAFAPLFWRVLYEAHGAHGMQVCALSLNAWGKVRGPAEIHTALPSSMGRALSAQSVAADTFLQFMQLPVVAPLPPSLWPADAATGLPSRSGPTDVPGYVQVYDLRFGSGLAWVRKLIDMRPHADIPFKYMAEIILDTAPGAEGEPVPCLLRERLRFSDSGRDSLWQRPRQVELASWPQRLAGLR